MKSFHLSWLIGFALLLAGLQPAAATSVIRLDVSGMSRLAASVVEGTVSEVNTAWNQDHTQIVSSIVLEVTDVYGGEAPVGRMEFRMLGGAIGDTTMYIVGAPKFAKGERLVLFLYDNPDYYIPVVGLPQGKMLFSTDTKTGREVVGNDLVGYFDKQELKAAVREAREGR